MKKTFFGFVFLFVFIASTRAQDPAWVYVPKFPSNIATDNFLAMELDSMQKQLGGPRQPTKAGKAPTGKFSIYLIAGPPMGPASQDDIVDSTVDLTKQLPKGVFKQVSSPELSEIVLVVKIRGITNEQVVGTEYSFHDVFWSTVMTQQPILAATALVGATIYAVIDGKVTSQDCTGYSPAFIEGSYSRPWTRAAKSLARAITTWVQEREFQISVKQQGKFTPN
jgi:hypothetical protein